MAEYTTNYQLHQWVPEDDFLRTDFNGDFLKLDTVLGRVETDLGAGGQNARVVWGTYAGDNGYGESNPNSLTFDFKPMLVMVFGTHIYGNSYSVSSSIFLRSATLSSSGLTVLWTDQGVNWYTRDTTSGNVYTFQLNNQNYTYYYLAIGVDESKP